MDEVKKVPVMFIHRGAPEYLKKTIVCAKEYKNRVILLGDDSNKKEQTGEWYAMADYNSPFFEEFKRVYRHCSKNSKQFELVCFERYFVLLEFMKREGIRECFMLDSDVLLFGEAAILLTDNFDMGGGVERREANPCVLYWTISALEDFVSFCLEQYVNKERWVILYRAYNSLREGNRRNAIGGISDMLLLKLWVEATEYKCENFFENDMGYVIDGNINCSECVGEYGKKYKMKRGLNVKRYIFKNEIPFLVDYNGKIERVLAIHCQGDAKKYIDLLYDRQFGLSAYYCLCDEVKRKMKLLIT